jgi:hypothetical protein
MISDVPHMLAVKATFDGQRIVLPDQVRGMPPGRVIVIFEEAVEGEDRAPWVKAQEAAFAKAWDNPEDEVYDRM